MQARLVREWNGTCTERGSEESLRAAGRGVAQLSAQRSTLCDSACTLITCALHSRLHSAHCNCVCARLRSLCPPEFFQPISVCIKRSAKIVRAFGTPHWMVSTSISDTCCSGSCMRFALLISVVCLALGVLSCFVDFFCLPSLLRRRRF